MFRTFERVTRHSEKAGQGLSFDSTFVRVADNTSEADIKALRRQGRYPAEWVTSGLPVIQAQSKSDNSLVLISYQRETRLRFVRHRAKLWWRPAVPGCHLESGGYAK